MIKSMTGYGLSSSIQGSSEVSVEIKGVNHRFLKYPWNQMRSAMILTNT